MYRAIDRRKSEIGVAVGEAGGVGGNVEGVAMAVAVAVATASLAGLFRRRRRGFLSSG